MGYDIIASVRSGLYNQQPTPSAFRAHYWIKDRLKVSEGNCPRRGASTYLISRQVFRSSGDRTKMKIEQLLTSTIHMFRRISNYVIVIFVNGRLK